MAENVEGSFAFSVLDSNNELWLIRGDSPLFLIHLPKYKLYVYASTDEILFKSLIDTQLFDEVKKGNMEEFDIKSGDILKITTDGSITADKFNYLSYSSYGKYAWWRYGISNSLDDDTYIEDLKSVAAYQGYSPDMIDELLESGFSPEEIEDYIYF